MAGLVYHSRASRLEQLHLAIKRQLSRTAPRAISAG